MQTSHKRDLDAVIFDLGNTLIYFEGEWSEVLGRARQALVNTLIDLGIPLDINTFIIELESRFASYYKSREVDLVESTTMYVLRSLLRDNGYTGVPDSYLRKSLDAFYSITQAHWKTEVDAISTLKLLKDHNFQIGIISNAGDDKDVQALVDKAGIRPYLNPIITSAAFGVRKPAPMIFQSILEHWDQPASRTAMVGDTLHADIKGAKNLGIYTIWITRRAASPAYFEHLDEVIPDAEVSSLSDLSRVLL